MLVIRAYAKVNLALEVVQRRADGWHDIDSVVAPIDWHDLVGIDLGVPGLRLQVTGSNTADVPAGSDNLVMRAADAVLTGAGVTAEIGMDVWLDKAIPSGAGLGGGSSDAAAVLRGATKLLTERGVSIDAEARHELAICIGSDVPATLALRPVRVRGRGEHITSIDLPPLHLVVVFLRTSATSPAYDALLPEERRSTGRVERLVQTFARGAPLSADLFGSALEPAARRVVTELAADLDRLTAVDPSVRWHMTGSGGAYFAIMPNVEAAKALALRCRAAGFVTRHCRTLSPD